MTPRHQQLLAAVVIVATALAVFGPALARGQVFTFRDHADYFQPLRLFTAQHLRAGRLPLWNPYNASGEPWLANPQTGVFYPPAWLFVVLPFATAYVAYLFAHALLMGWGAFLLFNRRASFASSVGAAVALMLSGPTLSLLDVSNNYTTFAWIPLVIFMALRDRRHPSPLSSACVLCLAFLAGEPFFAAVAALIYVLIVRHPRTVALAGAGAAGLSAVQLLPFLEMLHGSNRVGGFATGDILRSSLPWSEWLQLLMPPRFATSSQQFIFILYTGVLVVAIAGVGVIALVMRKDWPQLAAWGSLLVLSMVVATGPAVLARLPLTLFRYPARLVPLGVLAVVALFAAGWDQLRRGSAVVDAVLLAAIAVDLLVATKPLRVAAPFTRNHVPYDASIGRDRKILQAYSDVALSGGSRSAWVSGYLNLPELRFAALTAAPVTSERYMELYHQSLISIDTLREMGVGYVLASQRLPPPFQPIARTDSVMAYRVEGALAMAYVREKSGATTAVRGLALDASRAVVRATTAEGGLLILTQNDAPGWEVSVDGLSARGEVVLGTFRAVRIPAGVHEVVWRYHPLSLIVGAVTTSCAVLAMSFFALRAWVSTRDLSSGRR